MDVTLPVLVSEVLVTTSRKTVLELKLDKEVMVMSSGTTGVGRPGVTTTGGGLVVGPLGVIASSVVSGQLLEDVCRSHVGDRGVGGTITEALGSHQAEQSEEGDQAHRSAVLEQGKGHRHRGLFIPFDPSLAAIRRPCMTIPTGHGTPYTRPGAAAHPVWCTRSPRQ